MKPVRTAKEKEARMYHLEGRLATSFFVGLFAILLLASWLSFPAYQAMVLVIAGTQMVWSVFGFASVIFEQRRLAQIHFAE